MSVELVRNPDIVASVAAAEQRPFTVGFAAETNDVEHYARDKLARKNLDMIVANDVSAAATGFNSDDNEATVFWPGGEQVIERTSKPNMARALVSLIAAQLGD